MFSALRRSLRIKARIELHPSERCPGQGTSPPSGLPKMANEVITKSPATHIPTNLQGTEGDTSVATGTGKDFQTSPFSPTPYVWEVT